jgi:rhodanese-related sulfurtransferase
MQHTDKLNAIAEALEKTDPVAAEQVDILNNRLSAEIVRHTDPDIKKVISNRLSRKIVRRMIGDDILKGLDQNLLSVFQKYLDIVDKDWNYITPTELYDKIKSVSTEFFILDIRRKEDYDAGHIPGAKNIFWLDILKSENIAQLPKDKKILIYCYVGHTSSQLLVILKLLGYDVVALKFGMGKSPVKGVPVSGWLNYGYPIERTAPNDSYSRPSS